MTCLKRNPLSSDRIRADNACYDYERHNTVLVKCHDISWYLDLIVLPHEIDESMPLFWARRLMRAFETLRGTCYLVGRSCMHIQSEEPRKATNRRAIWGMYPDRATVL